jgi:hypothetical protein
MRILDPIFQRELNQLGSTHTITMLFQVDIAGAPVPFRLVNYDQPVSFHGLTFQPFPVSVESLEDATVASLVTLRVTAQNVTQEMQSLLENYWAPMLNPDWAVTIWQVDVVQPDLVPFGAGEVFTVSQVVTDFLTATFELIAEGVTLNRIVPRRRFTTSSGFEHIPRR